MSKPLLRAIISHDFHCSSHHAVHFDPETISAVHRAKALHALSISSASNPPVTVHHALIAAYAAADDLDSARQVFERMPRRTSVSYNAIIAATARRGCAEDAWALLPRMMVAGVRPTRFTFGPILSSLSLEHRVGIQLHPLILKSGLFHADPYSGTALMGFLARNDRLDDAVKLFEEMPTKTVVTWNCIISGFSELGFVHDSMFLFRELLKTGIGPSECSFLSVLAAFRSSDCLHSMEQIHGLAVKVAMDSFLVVANALLRVYSSCSRTQAAERYFNELAIRDAVSFNTMITAFATSAAPERAMDFFLMMPLEGLLPNESTFTSILNACASLDTMKYGELIHAKAIKHNLATGVFVGSSLVDFYAKYMSLDNAKRVFDGIAEKNVVCWNALISGYMNAGLPTTLVLLREMLSSGIRPNEFTFSSGLKQASALDLQELHALIIRMGYDSNEYVSSALIASYASHATVCDALALVSESFVGPMNVMAGVYNRAGRYKEAQELLSKLQEPDNISWNILLTACVRGGDYSKAFQLFKQMQISGYLFDNYTAVSLLSVCSKINSLNLGSLLHGLIIKTNSGCSDTFVHNVLLDMYAKCGSLESCLRVFEEMDEKNLISWTALISALGFHGCAIEALEKFKQMEFEGFEPDRVAFLAVLSACSHGGFVEEGMMFFAQMRSDYGIEPEMDHYICVVDLLCKYGHLKEAERVISGMPFQPDAAIWRIFLQGCRRYGSMVA
ncbi:pentatricopeptide repeat-containing protein At3g58590 [Phoenix dactylifera]|uniref:Pentatricopeptide repeat-containing protein At3g58590 n=1 Tax=Phoenix dactylifera TaxID=42345 RepID=A0A8B7CZU6_PHODC|nr:pentatricopeptide repeat-containing protein At3g58590 [Phoenix dactylifera]